MAMTRIIPEEHALARTLEKVNREIGVAAVASKRHTRLNAEAAALTGRLRRRRQIMPDR